MSTLSGTGDDPAGRPAGAGPPVPPELAERLREAVGGGSRPDPESLADAAEAALRRAVASGGSREGAFHLLVADGLLTWACEGLLDGGDPGGGLAALAARVARG